MVDHKLKSNQGFHWYFNNLKKIISSEKLSLNQWLQGIFFAMYAWSAGPVYWNDIDQY